MTILIGVFAVRGSAAVWCFLGLHIPVVLVSLEDITSYIYYPGLSKLNQPSTIYVQVYLAPYSVYLPDK